MRFRKVGLKLILLLLVVGTISNPASAQRGSEPTMPGMGTGPPTMGEWYRPPVLVVKGRTPAWTRDYVPNSAERKLLAASRDDLQQYAGFLRQPNTGSLRLLSYFPTRRVVSANSPDIAWRPGFSSFASAYSFCKRKHGHGVNGQGNSNFGWSDLRLTPGRLYSAVMLESLGPMVQLGDVPLDEVTTHTAGVSELADLLAPVDPSGAAALAAKHRFGYRANGFSYGSQQRVVVNTTYVLRSMLNRRVDHLIAFRVVRQDEEGVTIVWKKLRDYPKPVWTKKRD